MIYIKELAVIFFVMLLAGHDSTSYLLKSGGTNLQPLLFKRINRWHRDGAAIFCLGVFFLSVGSVNSLDKFLIQIDWKIIIASLLIRLCLFDIAFNKYASLPVEYIGNTAMLDKFFRGIFGENGALIKSATFFLILIILNFLNQYL